MKKIFLLSYVVFGLISCSDFSDRISEDEQRTRDIFFKLTKRGDFPKDSISRNLQFLDLLETDKSEFKAMSEITKGTYHWKYASLDSAKTHYNNALQYENLSDSLTGYAFAGLGNVHKDIGDYTKALEYYQSALKLSEKQKNQNSVAHIYKNIGALYMSWERFDESLDYYHKAEQTALSLKDSLLYADCNNNIGTVLEQQNRFDEAISRYNTALGIYERHRVTNGISFCYSNLAIVYKLKKEYNKAVDYNLKSLELSRQVNDKWMQSATLNNIGNLYREMGKFAQAKEYSNQSLALSKEINAPEIAYNTYETLMFIAFAEKDIDKAIEYQHLFIETKENFENAEVNRQLSELNIKYETEKKEKALAKQEVDLEKKNFFLIFLGGIVLIILILLRNYRVKSKLKQEQLLLENKLLEEQTHSKIQEQRLDISRELHDRVGSQLTFITSILDNLKKRSISDETVSQKINTLSDFADNSIAELRDTIWVLNSKKLTLEELKMKMLNFINEADEATDKFQFHFNFEISQNIQLSTKQTVNIYRIFQEIVNNSVKYSRAKDVFVLVHQAKNELNLNISDNGIGFDYESVKTKSFGLSNIQNRISELNGNLTVNSENGTVYNIKIPLQNP
ncbi:MAG: tetratricopeptide repeat protein [Flavobacteriaceae bacterium]